MSTGVTSKQTKALQNMTNAEFVNVLIALVTVVAPSRLR